MKDEVYLIVKSIDLLTIDEAEELPQNIRAIGKMWWLQTSDYISNYAASVYNSGSIDYSGHNVRDNTLNARPALLVENLDELNIPLYTELEIFDKDWIYIGKNKALAKEGLFRSRFALTSNDYATSTIKRKIGIWLIELKDIFNLE